MYSRKAANALLLIALLAGIFFLRKYLGTFALAALTTMLFAPVHNWFLKKKGRLARYATGLTVLTVLLTFLLPIVTIVGISFYEGSQIVNDLKQAQPVSEQQIDQLADKTTNAARSAGVNISRDTIRTKIQNAAKKAIPGILAFISRTTGNIVQAFTDAIVYFMLLWTMLSRKGGIIRAVKRLSPLDDAINDEYLRRVKAMAISMVKGTFSIAVVVGFIAALTLWVIGFPYIAFWFLLFTFLSIIPLGAGIVFIPIGIIMVLLGKIWQGLLILVVQFVVLNNVDNVLRPRLAPKENKLPGALLLISTFAGVTFFGLLGVVYGPIIMILIYTTIEMYDKYRDTGIPMKTSYAEPHHTDSPKSTDE